MSPAAKSVFTFGFYLSILGIILVVVPNLILTIFGLPETEEVWIRVVGVVVLALAIYYVQLSRKENRDFMWLSVYVRSTVIVFFTAFVLAGYVQPVLILFGAIDLLGALWTWRALKQ